MSSKRTFVKYYEGEGVENLAPMEEHCEPKEEKDPSLYLADPALRNAVNVAIMLGQPLLLTGLPGTGKTHLAHSVAWERGLEIEVFNAKTSSVARDLFYRYDSLRHFHAVHHLIAQKQIAPLPPGAAGPGVPQARDYIHLECLGRAIVRASKQDFARVWLPEEMGQNPKRSVVLIDEIDKAPRDLPNDVLNEFDRMEFAIDEVPEKDKYRAEPAFRPILILTSNSEKNLPDAFLRRCVFIHIDPPDEPRLRSIVRRRLGLTEKELAPEVEGALAFFKKVLKLDGLKKQPATAECIAWTEVLAARKIDLNNPEHLRNEVEFIHASFSVLAKSSEDLRAMKRLVPAPVPDATRRH